MRVKVSSVLALVFLTGTVVRPTHADPTSLTGPGPPLATLTLPPPPVIHFDPTTSNPVPTTRAATTDRGQVPEPTSASTTFTVTITISSDLPSSTSMRSTSMRGTTSATPETTGATTPKTTGTTTAMPTESALPAEGNDGQDGSGGTEGERSEAVTAAAQRGWGIYGVLLSALLVWAGW